MEMRNGDFIRNKKTGKIGIVIDNNYANNGILKWSLASAPKHHHVCVNPRERFELWEPKENEYICLTGLVSELGFAVFPYTIEVVNWIHDKDIRIEPFIGELPTFLKANNE